MDENGLKPGDQLRRELLIEASRRPRLPELTRKAMWATATAIVALTAGAVVALWWAATRGLTGATLVTARLDALKIGLSVGVGSGGVVALYLAWRRQRSTEDALDHQQQVAVDTRLDAEERRITELYTKAADQLGSDKAPVRLTGLYALERLAQDNRRQRQSIVNVFCAYLRMPYKPPETVPSEANDDATRDRLRTELREHVQEREVRLAAQRILTDHLQPARTATCWDGIDLDLTNAYLIDFDMRHGRVRNIRCDNATFTGGAWFRDAIFTEGASFNNATFSGGAGFDDATFTDVAHFSAATFSGYADFSRANFNGYTFFNNATFASDARFGDATLADDVYFGDATFTGRADFGKVTFAGGADFRKVTFTHDAHFGDATFTTEVGIYKAFFPNSHSFEGATQWGDPFVPPAAASPQEPPVQPRQP
jgi:uncharacterized protein YjbI with pentapeptide repeats